MNAVMYIFVNSQLAMSRGKLAAQAAHAAVEAYEVSSHDMKAYWRHGGHYTKLVMDGGDAMGLFTIDRYLTDRQFCTKLIIDEGHTEITPFQATALGVQIVNKDDAHVAATFGEFKLLKDKPSVVYSEPPFFHNEVVQRKTPSQWRRFANSLGRRA